MQKLLKKLSVLFKKKKKKTKEKKKNYNTHRVEMT